MKRILHDAEGNEIEIDDDFTMLGPARPEPPPPAPDLQAHMDSRLIGKSGPSAGESYVNSLEYQRDHCGLSQEKYDELTAHRKPGASKSVVDYAEVLRAQKKGFSR
jgi:hypothetical protein